MIGKIVTGKSFKGCISYLFEGRQTKSLEKQMPDKKHARVIHYNMCFGDKKELIKQFNEVRRINLKLGKPVFHATLSLALEDADRLSISDKADTAVLLAKAFGFSKNQFLVIEHQDTAHEHLHIVANRTGYDGKTASDSNSYKRMAIFCREIEQKFDLRKVESPKCFLAKTGKKRTDTDFRKEILKKHILNGIKQSITVSGLKAYLQKLEYTVELGRGIAFIDDKLVRFKGSQLGLALSDIERMLKQNFQIMLSKGQKEKNTSAKDPNKSNKRIRL